MRINTTCIIDDDPIFIFGSKILLRNNSFGSNIIVFQNGKEALDNIIHMLESDEVLPEVIFLDLNMPVMDGWEFLEIFSKIPKVQHIKVYVLSSSIDSRDMERAKQYEIVSDFIAKPLTDSKISSLIKNIEG